jgi:hypothetical protein
MLTVVGCLVEAHDPRLVALAAAICALSALTTVCLVNHARRADGRIQGGWLAVAAATGGFGIWATHFIAMLAYAPGVPGGYDLALTALSLVIAVALVGSGLSLAVMVTGTIAACAGGAILGLGIAAMHYTAMAVKWWPQMASTSRSAAGNCPCSPRPLDFTARAAPPKATPRASETVTVTGSQALWPATASAAMPV